MKDFPQKDKSNCIIKTDGKSDMLYGKIEVSDLVQKLSFQGFDKTRVDEAENGETIIRLVTF